MVASEIAIGAFNGDQETADLIATHHLAVRFQQRIDGESDFHGRIYSSQADLRDMQNYYVEPGGNFFIARDKTLKTIAGFIGLKKITATEGQIKRMAVLPSFRRQRIGSRLAQTAVDWAQDNGFQKLHVATGEREHAIHIYQAIGFLTVGRNKDRGDTLMSLDLA